MQSKANSIWKRFGSRNSVLLMLAAVMLGAVYAQSQAPSSPPVEADAETEQAVPVSGKDLDAPGSEDSALAAEEALLEAELEQASREAESDAGSTAPNQPPEPAAPPEAVAAEAGDSEEGGVDDIFEPTERVSEDSSVSFPVDI